MKICKYIFLFILFSCSKQEPPGLDDKNQEHFFEKKSIACSEVSFGKDILKKSNVIYFFECQSWDEKYKSLYQAIMNIKSQSWDHLIQPFGRLYLENHNVKMKVLTLTKKLIEKGGWDDLHYVLRSLMENNFYDELYELLVCTNENSEKCKRKGSLKRQDIKDLLHGLNFEKETLAELFELFKDLNNSMSIVKKNLPNEVKPIVLDEKFKSNRKEMINNFFSYVSGNVFLNTEVELIKNFFSYMSDDNGILKNWIFKWINQYKINKKELIDLLSFPVKVNPNIFQQIKILSDLSETDCQVVTGDKKVSISVSKYINSVLSTIHSENYESFLNTFVNEVQTLTVAANICNEIENIPNKYPGQSINRVFKDTFKFLSNSKNFALAQYVLKLSKEKIGSINSVLKSISREYVNNFIEILKVIGKVSPNLKRSYVEILLALDNEFFERLNRINQNLLSKKNISAVVAFSKIWNFLDDERGKEFFFKFVDRHFVGKYNFIELFKYYNSLLEASVEILPQLTSEYVNDQNINLTLDSLEDVAKNFRGRDTLRDFDNFLSRNNLLRLIELLVKGINYNYESLAVSPKEFEKLKGESSITNLPISYKEIGKKHKVCIGKLLEASESFSSFVLNYPNECSTDFPVPVRLFSDISKFANGYMKKNNVNLFDQETILNEKIISEFLYNMKSFSGKSKFEERFSYLRDLYIEDNFNEVLRGITDLYQEFYGINGKSNIVIRNKLLREAIIFFDKNEFLLKKEFVEVLEKLALWEEQNTYEKIVNDVLTRRGNISCVDSTKGLVENCPSKSLIKNHGSKMLYFMTRLNYEGRDSLSKFVDLLSERGVQISLRDENGIFIRLKLLDVVNQLYALTNVDNPKNKIQVELKTESGDISYNMNTLERVEEVVRSVRFDENYLGISFQNGVAFASNYESVVSAKKTILNTCMSVFFCGHKMNKKEKLLGVNSLNTYDGLIDLETEFGYGRLMQALVIPGVWGSTVRAQASALVAPGKPYEIPKIQSKKTLREHNGRVLTEFSMLGGFNHLSRFIKNNLGPTYEEAKKKLALDSFKKVNKELLESIDNDSFYESVKTFLNKLLVYKLRNGELLRNGGLYKIIDDKNNVFYDGQIWIFDESTIKVEKDKLRRKSLIFSSRGIFSSKQKINKDIGSLKLVDSISKKTILKFNPSYKSDQLEIKFEGESLFTHIIDELHNLDSRELIILEDLIFRSIYLSTFVNDSLNHEEQNIKIYLDVLNTLINIWVTNFSFKDKIINMKDLILRAHKLITFIDESLSLDQKSKSISLLTKFIDTVDKVRDEDKNIFNLIEALLVNDKNLKQVSLLFRNLDNFYSQFSILESGKAKKIRELGTIIKESDFKTSEIKNYMLMTTISCFKTDDINCSQNKHFDEVFKVLYEISGESDFSIASGITKFFRDYYEEMVKYLSQILSMVSVK